MEGLSSKAQAIQVFAAGIWGGVFVWHTLRKSCLSYHGDWKVKLQILFVSVSSGGEYLLQIILFVVWAKSISGTLVWGSCRYMTIMGQMGNLCPGLHHFLFWLWCLLQKRDDWLCLVSTGFIFLTSYISQLEWELVRLPRPTSQNILIVNNWVDLSYIAWVKMVSTRYSRQTDWTRKHLDGKMTLSIFLFSRSTRLTQE